MLARELAHQLLQLDEVDPGIDVRVVVEQHVKRYVVPAVQVEKIVITKASTDLPKGPKAAITVRIPRHTDRFKARK